MKIEKTMVCFVHFGETKPHSLDDMIREAEKKREMGEGDAAIEAKEKDVR